MTQTLVKRCLETDEEADRRLNLRGTLKLQRLEPRFTDFPLRGTEKFLRIEGCINATVAHLNAAEGCRPKFESFVKK